MTEKELLALGKREAQFRLDAANEALRECLVQQHEQRVRARAAEADNRMLDEAIDGLIADRDYFEAVAREAEDKLERRDYLWENAEVFDKLYQMVEQAEADRDKLVARVKEYEEAFIQLAIPYEAILADKESAKWIHPDIWGAIGKGMAMARAALRLTEEAEG